FIPVTLSVAVPLRVIEVEAKIRITPLTVVIKEPLLKVAVPPVPPKAPSTGPVPAVDTVAVFTTREFPPNAMKPLPPEALTFALPVRTSAGLLLWNDPAASAMPPPVVLLTGALTVSGLAAVTRTSPATPPDRVRPARPSTPPGPAAMVRAPVLLILM